MSERFSVGDEVECVDASECCSGFLTVGKRYRITVVVPPPMERVSHAVHLKDDLLF